MKEQERISKAASKYARKIKHPNILPRVRLRNAFREGVEFAMSNKIELKNVYLEDCDLIDGEMIDGRYKRVWVLESEYNKKL